VGVSAAPPRRRPRVSPLRNRVTPLGEIVADPARGLVYGNRGCLHDDHGKVRRRHQVKRWISCRLEFRGRRRAGLMMPGRYTELFFLDEATAFAAGHRPCAECRRDDYNEFVRRWSALHPGDSGADAIDARLHDERFDPVTRARRRHSPVAAGTLPDAAFVAADDGEPWLVLGDELLHWTPAGYDRRLRRPDPEVLVEPITPPSLLQLLRGGWAGAVPLLHPSARAR
jgi:hypothetical protein